MSKEKILSGIKAAKPADNPLPEIPAFAVEGPPASEIFGSIAAQSGSRVVYASDFENLATAVRTLFPYDITVATPLPSLKSAVNLQEAVPANLKAIDVAVLPGQPGVAENGAVWVTEQDCVHRVLPFIAQHLVLVLPQASIVRNMHEAYQRIKIDETGFGVFIAGPSKTADIEQSLVIGAQGARSLTIILT